MCNYLFLGLGFICNRKLKLCTYKVDAIYKTHDGYKLQSLILDSKSPRTDVSNKNIIH